MAEGTRLARETCVQERFHGRYEILAPLGEGGMGHVYRARHIGLDKIVALKLLTGYTPELVARFQREARAIARLDHPGCVRVLDYGIDATGAPFLAMELVEGPTLAEQIGEPWPLERAIQVAHQLVAALAHAHSHGVIHRDVKPENIVLARGGTRVVLIDFGLAALRDAPMLTGHGIAMGSPSYIAPERLRGHAHDARSDLYSVGVVLYELITGLRPILGSSPREVMHNALVKPPRPLSVLRPEVPAALEAVIRAALAKDPARRYPDAETMLSALADVAALLADEPPPTEEPLPSASTMLAIPVALPSLWARLWSWLRYGRWRWRHV